jgi:hypothetical protein
MRLVVFYPIAVQDCVALPNDAACLQGMWNWHTAVYEWGFLVVIVTMWLVWFWKVGGPTRTLDASIAPPGEWRLVIRRAWARHHLALVTVAALLLVVSVNNFTGNDAANDAKSTMETCQFLDLSSSECTQAQKDYNQAIKSGWSLAALGLAVGLFGGIEMQRPDENGRWPSATEKKESPELTDLKQAPVSRHAAKKKGSWKNRGSEEE